MQSGTGLGIDMDLLSSAARPPTFSNAVPNTIGGSRLGLIPLPSVDNVYSRPSLVAMRSTKGMAGLLHAEVGGSMVEINKQFSGHGTCFKEGKVIEPGSMTPIGQLHDSVSRRMRPTRILPHPGIGHRRGASLDQALSRQGTLLSTQASPERRAEELKRLLGDSSAKVKSGAVICTGNAQGKKSSNAVAFEQGKSRARVSLDLNLENNVAVEDGFLSGCAQVRVNPPKGCDSISIGCGKIRIAGFEVSPGNEHRHIFYQIAMPLASISSKYSALFASALDKQGFGAVSEGSYSLPFSLRLPVVTSGGRPRGVAATKCGATVKYIAIASFKIIDPSNGKRSIAHFYRDCEIWPVLDIMKTLSAAPQPIQGHAVKRLFMGGDGSLSLSASLHRGIWVAGQPIHVRVQVANETRKNVRSLGLAVLCTTTIFRPSPRSGGSAAFDGDPDACEAELSERKVADVVLVSGQKGAKGHASGKGWWTGVGPGESASLGHHILIPAEALTVTRVRLFEVEYALRVNLNVGTLAGSSDAIHVTLPIRIVSPISLDPPPSYPTGQQSSSGIVLATPKALNYAVAMKEPSVSRRSATSTSNSERHFQIPANKRKPHALNLYDGTAVLPPSGLPISSSAYANTAMCPRMHPPVHASHSDVLTHAPVPSYPATHVLQDFGGLESVEALDSVLGDIPGSVSMLENSYIPVDRSQIDSASRVTDDYGPEDIGSDEEIEMMVDCASARIQNDSYFPQQRVYPEDPGQPTLGDFSTLERNSAPARHTETYSKQGQSKKVSRMDPRPPRFPMDQETLPDAISRGRPADTQVRLTVNRHRLAPSLSPKRPTFSERVQIKKMQANGTMDSRTPSPKSLAELRGVLRCDTDDASSEDTEQSESPESIYSTTQSSATPCSQLSEDENIPEKHVESHSSNTHSRESSSDLRRSVDPMPFASSRIRSAPDRRGLREFSSSPEKPTGIDCSPVRRRIALLEEKTRQETGGVRPSFVTRHTHHSVPLSSYTAIQE